jgi:hypothetical protein
MYLVRKLNSKLRLTLLQLAIRQCQRVRTYPTPPSPTSAVREPGTRHFVCIWSNISSLLTKSASGPKGIIIDGHGGVSGRSLASLNVSACSCPAKSQLIRNLPGGSWIVALTWPWLMPSCKPVFASPNDIAELIMMS